MQTIVIYAVVGGVLIIVAVLVFDALGRLVTSLGSTCTLFSGVLMADSCVGSCAAGSKCTALTTRPYFGGVFGLQAASCACVVTSTTGGGAGTAGGSAGGSSGGSSGDEAD